jgi:alanine racemase
VRFNILRRTGEGKTSSIVRMDSLLTLDLGALVANWRMLAEHAGGREKMAAVVKADGYGIGLAASVRALASSGCSTFFVAHLAEGVSARKEAPEATIYVLNGLAPGQVQDFLAHRLRPVLGSGPELAEWQGQAEGCPAALHVDTGMNRLGLPLGEALAFPPQAHTLNLALVMSHFLASEQPDHPANARQITAFEAVREAFAGIPASLVNSSGLFLSDSPVYDLARPGYALYGGNPVPGRLNPMRPVVRLETRIVQIREVQQGTGAGYHARWTAPGPRRLATLSFGYADGLLRCASGTDTVLRAGLPHAEVLIAGYRCPIVGAISMDLSLADITSVPDSLVRRGTLAIVLNEELDIDQAAKNSSTIGYEILTSLSRRAQRVYIG